MPDYLSMATKLGAIESVRKPFKPEGARRSGDGCLWPGGRRVAATRRVDSDGVKRRRSIWLLSAYYQVVGGFEWAYRPVLRWRWLRSSCSRPPPWASSVIEISKRRFCHGRWSASTPTPVCSLQNSNPTCAERAPTLSDFAQRSLLKASFARIWPAASIRWTAPPRLFGANGWLPDILRNWLPNRPTTSSALSASTVLNWSEWIDPARSGPLASCAAPIFNPRPTKAFSRRPSPLPRIDVPVSSIELNRERGVIETPHVPTLRVASLVSAPDGKPFGVVIINIDMRPIFAGWLRH